MAVTINRTVSDGGQTTVFEVVSTGEVGTESGTALDVSSLVGAGGDGRERVRVLHVKALVCGADSNVTLEWDSTGTNIAFLTLPEGSTDMPIRCDPSGSDLTGDIAFSSTAATPFTLHVRVEKIQSFSGSMATISKIM